MTAHLFYIKNTPKRQPTQPKVDQKRITLEKGQLETIDLIINVLRDHEKSLDNLLDRLDTLTEALSTILARMEYYYDKIETPAK